MPTVDDSKAMRLFKSLKVIHSAFIVYKIQNEQVYLRLNRVV